MNQGEHFLFPIHDESDHRTQAEQAADKRRDLQAHPADIFPCRSADHRQRRDDHNGERGAELRDERARRAENALLVDAGGQGVILDDVRHHGAGQDVEHRKREGDEDGEAAGLYHRRAGHIRAKADNELCNGKHHAAPDNRLALTGLFAPFADERIQAQGADNGNREDRDGGRFRQAHQARYIIHDAGLEEGHRRALQQLAEGDPAEVLVAERML